LPDQLLEDEKKEGRARHVGSVLEKMEQSFGEVFLLPLFIPKVVR
jgi:hypothetical protein